MRSLRIWRISQAQAYVFAHNFVFHLRVSDVNLWWNRIVALDLAERYRVKVSAPRPEIWGMAAGIIDPSGVLWRIAGPVSKPE
jgi:hypothetical protein